MGPKERWIAIAFCILCCTSGGDLQEFRDREEETLVNCVHDTTPRFGKRICDCGYRNEQFRTPRFEGSTTEIEIANCKWLRIRQDTFSQLFQLTNLSIVNVEDLILESNSFDFSRNSRFVQLKIHLINNVIEEIPSHLIKGPVAEVTFTRCRVGIFRPFSITNIYDQLYSLSFVESFINRIERHAFKRFDVNHLTINSTKFIAPVPSQSFYEVEVLDRFMISNSSFYALLPSAFSMKNVTNLLISHNEFNDAAGEAFTMQIRKSVRITGNYFYKVDGAVFEATKLDSSYYTKHSEKPTLYFHNNRVVHINDTNALRFSDDFDIHLRQIYIEQSINCDQVAAMEGSVLQRNMDEVYFYSTADENNFNTLGEIRRFQCSGSDFWFWLIIGSVCGALVLVIICLAVTWYCVEQKKKQKRKLEVIMPEPRTYRETQIVMQIENHGLLKTDL